MRVIIAGGGIGGLALAQGLRQRDVSVRVLERDLSSASAGYRLHLDPAACTALQTLLPAAIYQALLASATGGSAFRQFTVLDHHGQARLRLPRNSDEEFLDLGRAPLRRLLATGLEEVIRWGSRVERYEHQSGGSVAVQLDDGSVEVADVLVGADGARSRVAAQLLGQPSARPAGLSAIAGRTPLTDAARELLPAPLTRGPAFVVGPNGVNMFLSAQDMTTDPARIGAVPSLSVPPILEDDYLVWSIATATEQWGPKASFLDPVALQQRALAAIPTWSASLRELVQLAPPESTAWFDFHLPVGLRSWPAGNVTLLGDAVHPMPPTAGAGASTALRDAVALVQQLCDTSTPVPLALYRYQTQMLQHARSALKRSGTPLRWQRRLIHPMTRTAATRLLLPALDLLKHARQS